MCLRLCVIPIESTLTFGMLAMNGSDKAGCSLSSVLIASPSSMIEELSFVWAVDRGLRGLCSLYGRFACVCLSDPRPTASTMRWRGILRKSWRKRNQHEKSQLARERSSGQKAIKMDDLFQFQLNPIEIGCEILAGC